jgi:hypothetical protein
MIDEPSRHFPDRIEIELHVDPDNLGESTGFLIPLYRAFTPNHLPGQSDHIEVDTSLLVIGFAREHKVVVISCLTRDIFGSQGHYSRPACIGTNFSGALS